MDSSVDEERPPAQEPKALLRVTALDKGVQPASGGASNARFMQTTEGDFHVKFPRSTGEARRGPANEMIAARLLERLGVDRGALALVGVAGRGEEC